MEEDTDQSSALSRMSTSDQSDPRTAISRDETALSSIHQGSQSQHSGVAQGETDNPPSDGLTETAGDLAQTQATAPSEQIEFGLGPQDESDTAPVSVAEADPGTAAAAQAQAQAQAPTGSGQALTATTDEIGAPTAAPVGPTAGTFSETEVTAPQAAPPATTDADAQPATAPSDAATTETPPSPPSLAITVGNAIEDSPVALGIAVVTDGTPVVTIAGLPDGAGLSAGVDNGDGSWTLTADKLSDLTLLPPTDFNGGIALSVSVTDSASGATTAQDVTVSFAPVADIPVLSIADVSGVEDGSIPLDIVVTSPDTVSVAISNVPAGALLSAGTSNGDGTWTLDVVDLAGLTLTPPVHFNGDLTLEVTATATDGAESASTSDSFTVSVAAVADAPVLTVSDVAGSEDGAIALDITATSPDTLTVTISGVPTSAALSTGIDNGDGSWTLAPNDLAGLTLTPPADFNGDLTLDVTATATEGAETASTTDSFTVSVAAVADAPILSEADVAGSEDGAIALDIAATSPDTLSVTISGVPAGATLSAGTDNGDGSWMLAPEDLAGLTLTPPADFNGDLTLDVTATATDGAESASTSDSFTVSVAAVADAPVLTVSDVAGSEDGAIALDIAATSPDALSVTISGVPAGATLSAGIDNGDGSWTLAPEELAGLTLTPPADFNGDLTLDVTATATEGAETASTTDSFTVSVAAVADAPVLTVSDVAGSEDGAIALDITATSPDTLTVTVSGIPTDATLSAGIDNGDGSWTLAPEELAGLTLTPPADFNGDLTLEVTATATDGTEAASTSDSFTVSVAPVADAPVLALSSATGFEETAIALDIAVTSPDVTAVIIANVPAGVRLSAGTDNGDGSWSLDADDLPNLTLTPPLDYNGTFDLMVTATATDGGDTASVDGTLSVTVDPVAEPALLSLVAATGLEDTSIALTISAIAAPGETVQQIVLADLPEGATLSAGVDNGDGTWSVAPEELAGLSLIPAADINGEFTLNVTAITEDGGALTAVSQPLALTITPVADAPVLIVSDATGAEDSAIALSISATSVDTTSVTLSGVPAGAVLSAGTDNGDGTWTLDAVDLSALTLTPPADFNGAITVDVTATAIDGTDTASSLASFTVNVTAVADAPTIVAAAVTGDEDTAIALNLSVSSPDAVSVLLSGVPAGAVLSAGIDNGDGSWTLLPEELASLTLTPPLDFNGDIGLTLTATATDGADTATTETSFTVSVSPVADKPTGTVTYYSGLEDSQIPLTIAVTSPDTHYITISGYPEGSSFTAGTDNDDGTWHLEPGDLAGLKFVPAEDFYGAVTMSIAATAVDGDGSATGTATFTFNVWNTADAADLAPQFDAPALEDTAVDFAIDIGTLAPTETAEITISGLTTGMSLSVGQDQGGGTWTLTEADLDGLTISASDPTSTTLHIDLTVFDSQTNTTATSSTDVAYDVLNLADAPTVQVSLSHQPIEEFWTGLHIDIGDLAATETLEVIVDGISSHGELNNGTLNADGTYSLTEADLQGLQFVTHSGSDFTFEITATVTDDTSSTTASTTKNQFVDVIPNLLF